MVYDAQSNYLKEMISDRKSKAFYKKGNENRQGETLSITQKIANDDKSAVVECLQVYGDLIWNLALQFHFLPAETEHAVREVFLDIWKYAGRFDPVKINEKDFIIFIARHRLIRFLKNIRKYER